MAVPNVTHSHHHREKTPAEEQDNMTRMVTTTMTMHNNSNNSNNNNDNKPQVGPPLFTPLSTPYPILQQYVQRPQGMGIHVPTYSHIQAQQKLQQQQQPPPLMTSYFPLYDLHVTRN